VVAESVLVKQQLLILNRSRKRSRAMCTDILHFPARVLVIQAARMATGERG